MCDRKTNKLLELIEIPCHKTYLRKRILNHYINTHFKRLHGYNDKFCDVTEEPEKWSSSKNIGIYLIFGKTMKVISWCKCCGKMKNIHTHIH